MIFLNNIFIAFAGIAIGFRLTEILYKYWIKFCYRFFGLTKEEKQKLKKFKRTKKIYKQCERRIIKMPIIDVKKVYVSSWELYLEGPKNNEEDLRTFYNLKISGEILIHKLKIDDDITPEDLYDMLKNSEGGE